MLCLKTCDWASVLSSTVWESDRSPALLWELVTVHERGATYSCGSSVAALWRQNDRKPFQKFKQETGWQWQREGVGLRDWGPTTLTWLLFQAHLSNDTGYNFWELLRTWPGTQVLSLLGQSPFSFVCVYSFPTFQLQTSFDPLRRAPEIWSWGGGWSMISGWDLDQGTEGKSLP